MILKLLLAFLCGVRAQQGPPPLLLVSFDGFRADYLQRFPMVNLKLLYGQGVLVEELTNAFITKTFPNHYTLVTGLYTESHGIVANTMYDPIHGTYFHIGAKNEQWWWNEAEPIWVTALNSGYKTAAGMWPGTDLVIRNQTPTYFLPYNSAVTFRQRVENVTNWILGDGKEDGAKFATLYWEEPDRSGHFYGPDNTTAMDKVLKEVDDNIGVLVSELKRTGLWGHINVLIVSDHGMTQLSTERLIRLDDCISPDTYTVVDLTPVAAILPHKDPENIVNLLNKCHSHMKAYLKEDIPDRLHYRNNVRIQPVIVVADEGWTIVQNGNKLNRLGDHGFDNALPSMHPFFAATGPSFRQGYKIKRLHSVDIYPLMCHLLSVPPQPNNGSMTQARCLLAAESCWDVSMTVRLLVGILLLIAAVAIVFKLVCHRKTSEPLIPKNRVEGDHDFL